jgi:hypothetical protein
MDAGFLSNTLDPNQCHANITLSNGYLTASNTVSAWTSVKGVVARSSGVVAFSVTLVSGSFLFVGLGDAGSSLSNYAGGTSNSLGFDTNSGSGAYFTLFTGATQSGAGFSVTAGDVIKLEWDADAGTVTLYKNGTSQGQKWSGVFGTLFPMLSFFGSTSATIDLATW